jgi:FKBP-type peptidyl-prolyl cis-trans isomerase SlyD
MPSTPQAIAAGHAVAIYYTLTDDAGQVLDTNKGQKKPLVYLAGVGNIVKGLDDALMGAARGETRKVDVAPADGYGEWTEEALETIPRSAFPPEAEVVKGAVFHGQTPDGLPIQVRVHEADGDEVKVDKSHPLAGQTLHFEVYVYGIRQATEEEKQHGHAHGPGGHQH